MQLPLRRAISAAASSARLRRGLSTAASRPQWAIIEEAALVNSTSHPPSSSPATASTPCPASTPTPEAWASSAAASALRAATASSSSSSPTAPPRLPTSPGPAPLGTAKWSASTSTRLVCNPLSGEMVRLPDIDGTKKVRTWHAHGILTQSVRGNGPPDRYAVAELSVDGEGDKRSFVMRRFFSEGGEWDKLVLPSPLPRPRRIDIDHEVLAFAERLWWVDLTWGAVSADPFSDRPELRFVELPRASVWPLPGPGPATRVGGIAIQGRYRRMGVSEGRLRYAEVSQKEPFLLSSYALDEDGDDWTLEHQVALSQIWADAGKQEDTPRIGVIDPLNTSSMCVLVGNHSLAIDMDTGKVLGCSMVNGGGPHAFWTALLKPCVLPPWLGSSRIPSAGKKEGAGNKTLADVLWFVQAENMRDEVY